MQHIICSIYDTAIQAYMRPYTAQTPGEATRMFTDEVQRPDSPMGKHPEDYALFQLAEFNDNEGTITSPLTPLCLAKAHEVLHLVDKNPTLQPFDPVDPKEHMDTLNKQMDNQ